MDYEDLRAREKIEAQKKLWYVDSGCEYLLIQKLKLSDKLHEAFRLISESQKSEESTKARKRELRVIKFNGVSV